MKKKLKKVRPVIFGIRFKFSVIMIAGMAFVSILIGLALYNQNEKKITDTIKRLSGTVLKGTADPAERYLRSLHTQIDKSSSPAEKRRAADIAQKAKNEMRDYFSSVIKKEKILDIAFLIDINWSDTEFDFGKRNSKQYLYKTQYKYFDQNTGNLFTVHGNRRVFAYSWNDGRYDDQLSPTVYKFFMNNVFTGIYHGRREHTDKKEKDYVITGIPLFDNPYDARLYEYFIEFISSGLKKTNTHYNLLYNKRTGYCARKQIDTSSTNWKDRLSLTEKTKAKYRTIFTEKIIDGEMNIDYDIVLNTEKKKNLLYFFLVRNYTTKNLDTDRRTSLQNELRSILTKKKEVIAFSDLRLAFYKILKKYSIPLKNRNERSAVWISFYYFLKNNGVETHVNAPVEELALIAYRKDLAGILGLFLQRKEFSMEMAENRTEIINLIISILIRAFFIALFFPTFIIKKIASLADGALEIGRGNLDKKLDIRGSDELGRLADIFNAMTGNLKKAQEEMLVKQRMENELITAQQIQNALLPEELPDVSGIQFGSYYAAQTESGGDYYDFITLDDGNIGITMADVSGHGVGSGLVMAMTRTLLHTYCTKTNSPRKIFEQINGYLKENTASNFFVTMFYGILNITTKKITYSSAGHNPGIIVRNKKIIELPAGGIALGATSNDLFLKHSETKEASLSKGDYFIQYTDGVDEAMDKNDTEFGLERFHKALLANFGKNPQDLINGVVEEINRFTGKIPQHDDITIIAIRIV